MLTLNASVTLRISSFSCTSESIQYDTCIPMMYGLNFGCRSTETSFPVNFERFTDRRFPLYSRNCQTPGVPRQSRGFTQDQLGTEPLFSCGKIGALSPFSVLALRCGGRAQGDRFEISPLPRISNARFRDPISNLRNGLAVRTDLCFMNSLLSYGRIDGSELPRNRRSPGYG